MFTGLVQKLGRLERIALGGGSGRLSVGADFPNPEIGESSAVNGVCLTLTAHAAETSGKCGDNLTWSFDAGSGTLTISGYGEMYNVGASIDYSDPNEPHYIPDTPWFGYAKQITEIRLQEGLISIGSGAFAGCSRLRNVTLPNSLTTIGSSAFRECSSLQSVSISDGVIDIFDLGIMKRMLFEK